MAESFDLEVALLERGVPAEVRSGVVARPCRGCRHRRDWHTGWMNLYRCDAEALSSDDCDCSGYDVIDGDRG